MRDEIIKYAIIVVTRKKIKSMKLITLSIKNWYIDLNNKVKLKAIRIWNI